ncbi:MAG: hypothetical protein H0V17_12505 [Deltaproteobacteria bacterium]|nr:hypothetical protein [Deltaproteobacteria bacterium]
MSIFKYVVQGIGWEIGREAAREGIDTLKEGEQPTTEATSERQLRQEAREREKQADRERTERAAAAARKQAEIEAQLVELKKRTNR